MLQRSAGASYLCFSAGFSLLVYRLFVWCDFRVPLFQMLGTNALAAYILAGWTEALLFLAVTWAVLRVLALRGWYLRL